MSKLHLATRSASTFVRILQFLICILILGIFSYYLAWLSKHDKFIPKNEKAVEGMSGIGVIYTAFGVLLTCFLGGKTFFALLAIVLDICFVGAFIAIAVLTRGGSKKCDQFSNSPIGFGHYQSCQLQRAAFAVAIVNAFLFVISAGLQVLLLRHHKNEKKYGPSPANNYTSGSAGRKFWGRKNRKNRQAELRTMNAAGDVPVGDDSAQYDTKDINGVENGYGGANNKYATPQPTAPAPATVGYTPQGTGYQSTGYVPQQSGVVGTGEGAGVSEMPGSTAQTSGGYVH